MLAPARSRNQEGGPAVAEAGVETPMAAQARWVFRTLERINAGESVPSEELVSHFAARFLEAVPPERMLAAYRDIAPVAAQISGVETEFERDTSISLVTTLGDGGRYRWEFDVEPEPPHCIATQVWTGPLAAYTDRLIKGPDADVLVRDYTDTGPGPEQVLLLHCAGGHVGAWDTVVPNITASATVHAIDLRGHGRADARHPYTTRGCLDDIAAATGDISPGQLILAGHSLGGHVGLEHAVRIPCRGFIALDGPAYLRHDVPAEDIAASPEPAKSIHADLNNQDVSGLIRDLTTPALFILCKGSSDWDPEWVEGRHELAEHATRHGHRVQWIDIADHNFGWNMPELTGQLITDFLATLTI